MNTVGVREFRQRASDLLRRVEAGETIQVTDRGRLVALLSPIPDVGPLERLRTEGGLYEATGDWDGLAEPLELEPGQELPSSVLAALRAEER